jgi:hypothetical protein
MDTRNTLRIVQNAYPKRKKTGVLKLYKLPMQCAIAFPVFLKFLTNAEYLISDDL